MNDFRFLAILMGGLSCFLSALPALAQVTADAAALDKTLRSFPAEVAIAGNADSYLPIKASVTSNCVSKFTTKKGVRTINWRTVTTLVRPSLFDPELKLVMGKTEIYIAAAITEDDEDFSSQLAAFTRAAIRYHEGCRAK